MVSYLPITIVPNKTFQQNERSIYISYSLAKYWRIEPLDIVNLCIGINKIPVQVKVAGIDKDVIHVGDFLFEGLHLPQRNIRFLSQYNRKNKYLFIGPIIALMTEFNENDALGEPDFGSVHTFCEELSHLVSTIGGIFYVFHLKDFSEQLITGYYNEDGTWIKREWSLPNVIYNRIHSRRVESSDSFKKAKEKLDLLNIPLFNARFLSKWEVHELFSTEEHIQPYLPETKLCTAENLATLLDKHKGVFIKPIHGSQGRNIVKVDTTEEGKLLVETSSGKQQGKKTIFNNPSSFYKWFQSRHIISTYIIQQSIPLLNFDKRQLDFRVLCHKNYQDSWKITSVVARISAENQFVSNVARGGETMKAIKALSQLFDIETAIQQVALLKELAIETASIMSQSDTGIIGELGIDIGVDHNGKLWIIEVNSKPSKNFEEQDVKVRPSTKAIIEYCTALAFRQPTVKEE